MKRLLALSICVSYFIILEVFALVAMIVCVPFCFSSKSPDAFCFIRNLFFKHSIIVMKYFYPKTYQLAKEQAKAFSENKLYL